MRHKHTCTQTSQHGYGLGSKQSELLRAAFTLVQCCSIAAMLFASLKTNPGVTHTSLIARHTSERKTNLHSWVTQGSALFNIKFMSFSIQRGSLSSKLAHGSHSLKPLIIKLLWCLSAHTTGVGNEHHTLLTWKGSRCPLLLHNEQQTCVNLPCYFEKWASLLIFWIIITQLRSDLSWFCANLRT